MKLTIRSAFTLSHCFAALSQGRKVQLPDQTVADLPFPLKGKTALAIADWQAKIAVLDKNFQSFKKGLGAEYIEWRTDADVPPEAAAQLTAKLDEEVDLACPKISRQELDEIEGLPFSVLAALQEIGVLEEPVPAS